MYTQFSVSFNVLLPSELVGSPFFDFYVGYIESYKINIINRQEECSCKWLIPAQQVSEFVFLTDVFIKWIYPNVARLNSIANERLRFEANNSPIDLEVEQL